MNKILAIVLLVTLSGCASTRPAPPPVVQQLQELPFLDKPMLQGPEIEPANLVYQIMPGLMVSISIKVPPVPDAHPLICFKLENKKWIQCLYKNTESGKVDTYTVKFSLTSS